MLEVSGSIYVIGGIGVKRIGIKIVEAFDLKITPDWRRC
jgi:hypothetical protein